MRTPHQLVILLLLGNSAFAVARPIALNLETRWVKDGDRTCTFDGAAVAVKCTQYHQVTMHKIKGGDTWSEYRWMWKASGNFEVRYASRIGLVGVSNFTIGDLFDPNSKLPGHASKNAVSYAPSRDELIIGIPAEGYEFAVEGGGF
jgi:hypothetical protein